MTDSLRPHESQHTRPPCPSPTPRVHPDSRASSQWCHPAVSSSVVPFSSCPQSFPASESFPMSQPFAWGGQSTGVSALASFLPKKSQGWSPPEWTGIGKQTWPEASLLLFMPPGWLSWPLFWNPPYNSVIKRWIHSSTVDNQDPVLFSVPLTILIGSVFIPWCLKNILNIILA